MMTGDAASSAASNRSLTAKRLFDVAVASILIVPAAPVAAIGAVLVWAHDRQDPIYRQVRVGKDAIPFTLLKLRSMSAAAPGSTSDTTGHNDPRITPIGAVLRKTKIDELPQLWNVIRGDMSLVGPRPQVPREVALYTQTEKGLLAVRPGVTDYASIVYSDLGDIVATAPDPDLAYSQLVRPGKSRLGLFYAAKPSVLSDLAIIALTAVALVDGRKARKGVAELLKRQGAPGALVEIAARLKPLEPAPPPGATAIVTSREAQFSAASRTRQA